MASASEAYFPSLDKCFSQAVLPLLSWREVFLHICNPEKELDSAEIVHSFLSHPESIRLLSNSLDPFVPPSSTSKAEFESKTAAIHVNVSPQARYNLDEIKADALWLSQKAAIDEITALRIAVLEWQSRPTTQLLAGFAEEETMSVLNAAGDDDSRTSLVGSRAMDIGNKTDDLGFSSERPRRVRLQQYYLSEKSHIVKTSRKLLSLSLRDHIPSVGPDGSAHNIKKTGVKASKSFSDLGAAIFKDKTTKEGNIGFLQECIKAISRRVDQFTANDGWMGTTEADEESEAFWRITTVEEIVHIMQIIFLRLQASPDIPTADLLLSWLRLLTDSGFLESFSVPSEDFLTLFVSLQALVAMTTLAFLKLPVTMPSVLGIAKESTVRLTTSPPYFLSRERIAEINEIFINAVNVGIKSVSLAAFAWGMILHTMRELALMAKETREMEQCRSAVNSFQSNTPAASPNRGPDQSLYEELMDCVRIPAYGDDFVNLLTVGALERGRVFDVIINLADKVSLMSAIDDNLTNCWIRVALLDVVRCSTQFLDYSPEIVQALLAILTDPSSNGLSCDEFSRYPSDPRLLFLRDSDLMNRVFRLARSRFPYEAVPFLKVCRALIIKDIVTDDGLPAILEEVEAMETFTQVVSSDFHGYETIREDENANFVALVQPILMIDSISKKPKFGDSAKNALIVTSASRIPATTTGQVISESKPVVIMWHHQYSFLSFLGNWLETWANDEGTSDGFDEDSIAEIVGLLTDLISSAQTTRSQGDYEPAGKKVLELASDGLTSHPDIVSVVTEILERNLQDVGYKASVHKRLDLAISCMQFIRALITISPNRVWPFLSRSCLLGAEGRGGLMTSVIAAIEVTSGEYTFLLTCIRLFDAIVEDAMSNAAIRRAPHRISLRSGNTCDFSAGIPSHIMSNVLQTFVRAMVEVYNSNKNWRFNDPEQKLEMNALIASTLERILYYAYGIDDSEKPDSKITGVFSASASYILEILRPHSSEEMPFNPVLQILFGALQTPIWTIYLRQLTLIERQSTSTLKLVIKLIQAAQVIGSSPSPLEDQLFKATPVLVKLYALHSRYRMPVLTLLDLLISKAASNSENEPPSLLGHLGAKPSCLFLDLLAQFDKPLKDSSLFISIWEFLSSLVSKRQQWFAVYLLTGTSPRDSLKPKEDRKETPTMRGLPFLHTAFKSLSKIDQFDPQTALSLLEFVSLSLENWPWAIVEMKRHADFLNDLINYISNLDICKQSLVNQIYLTKIAAITADICTIYLHSAKETRDRAFFKTLIPLVSWFAQNAVEVSGYNVSLHANLKKNFEMKYAGCKLLNFKRTPLQSRPPGSNYYYDMDLAKKLLSYDFSWNGTRNQGFAEEFERANLNLSLVEAQVGLFHSWRFFAVEHCADFMPDREVQKSMALVVQKCLVANTRDLPKEALFDRLQQSRIDFALALLQRLVEIGSKGSEVFSLLGIAWDAIRARGATYENALIHDDTEYYRSLLSVLFLSLQFHLPGPSRASPEALSKKPHISSDLSIVLEVVKVIIAQGFKSLTTYLHDEPGKCCPRDFAILIAILQTALRVKNAHRLYEQIAFHIQDNDTARYAVTLFSWSDQLTIDGDPVYGELSMSFLVELSTVPMLAEHLAVEGVLMKLSACRLSNILQQAKGFGPFEPIPRLYTIWDCGILPLCLNLLYHVNGAAPEVATFLNQFEGQLARAAENFTGAHSTVPSPHPAKRICLSMASEAYSLALISLVLTRLRDAGPSAGLDAQAIQELKWDKPHVKEDIEELLGRRQILRSRLVATTTKEHEFAKQRPVNNRGAEHRLEERMVSELTAVLLCLGGGEVGS